MGRLCVYLLIFCCLAGCDSELDVCGPILRAARTFNKPVVDPPAEHRQPNWLSYRRGSCAWATCCTVLNSQGRPDLAEYVKTRHGGPASYVDVGNAMSAAGIALRQSANPDTCEAFIDQCMSEGGDKINGDHFVTVVHADAYEVGFIDPNDTSLIEYVPREDFLAECKRCGGWVLTFEY
jgi:hypothetical protein